MAISTTIATFQINAMATPEIERFVGSAAAAGGGVASVRPRSGRPAAGWTKPASAPEKPPSSAALKDANGARAVIPEARPGYLGMRPQVSTASSAARIPSPMPPTASRWPHPRGNVRSSGDTAAAATRRRQQARPGGTVSAAMAVGCASGSASVFDNRYFANLLDGRVYNATTRAKVAESAQSQDGFFASWAASYAGLTRLGVKTGADGEIRRTCSSAAEEGEVPGGESSCGAAIAGVVGRRGLALGSQRKQVDAVVLGAGVVDLDGACDGDARARVDRGPGGFGTGSRSRNCETIHAGNPTSRGGAGRRWSEELQLGQSCWGPPPCYQRWAQQMVHYPNVVSMQRSLTTHQ